MAMQGVEARIVGKVYEIKDAIGNGPVVVVVRVSHGKDKNTGYPLQYTFCNRDGQYVYACKERSA